MSKEDIKKFIKSQNIEVKIDPKNGKAEGNLFQKPKIVPSNNPSVKVGQTLSGKINFKNSNTGNQIVKPGQEITGKVTK
jgi:hypothetical protein